MKEIYLDNAATTKTYSEVVKAMNEVLLKDYGNPSSLHKKGEKAFDLINKVKKKISSELGCKTHEIIFTSGATEANNLGLQGIAKANKSNRNKIFISSIEHPSVSETANALSNWGFEIVRIPVNSEGFIDFKFLEREVDSQTLLVSVMLVNNVFGTIQDIRKIGRFCRDKGVLFHTDAVQGFGKLKMSVNDWCIDLLSGSGHKIGGPKGIGFLYIREGIKLMPLFYGGGQESGLRSGTENVPSIVGFGKALELYKKENWKNVEKMRDYFILEVEKIGGKINGSKKNRISNNLHFSFSGVDSEKLVLGLSQKEIYVSSGSACDSKKKKEDLVLKAIGVSDKDARSSIRISLSPKIRKKDVDFVIEKIEKMIR